MTEEQAAADLERYCAAMMRADGWNTCLQIERRYGLDGYPPQIVTTALRALADGEDMDAVIDALIGGEEAAIR